MLGKISPREKIRYCEHSLVTRAHDHWDRLLGGCGLHMAACREFYSAASCLRRRAKLSNQTRTEVQASECKGSCDRCSGCRRNCLHKVGPGIFGFGERIRTSIYWFRASRPAD